MNSHGKPQKWWMVYVILVILLLIVWTHLFVRFIISGLFFSLRITRATGECCYPKGKCSMDTCGTRVNLSFHCVVRLSTVLLHPCRFAHLYLHVDKTCWRWFPHRRHRWHWPWTESTCSTSANSIAGTGKTPCSESQAKNSTFVSKHCIKQTLYIGSCPNTVRVDNED